MILYRWVEKSYLLRTGLPALDEFHSHMKEALGITPSNMAPGKIHRAEQTWIGMSLACSTNTLTNGCVDNSIAEYHNEEVEEDAWEEDFRSFCTNHMPWTFIQRGVLVEGSLRGCEETFYAPGFRFPSTVYNYPKASTQTEGHPEERHENLTMERDDLKKVELPKGASGGGELTGDKDGLGPLSPLTEWSDDEEN